MADTLPATVYYEATGGLNLKASKYDMATVQFLKLYNVDFEKPKALQQRPGSTLAIAGSLSGPVNNIFEYQKLQKAPLNLVPSDFILAADGTAVFAALPLAASFSNSYTLISAGWTSSQPVDMLTFINKAWMANGQKWQTYDGVSALPVGLPTPPPGTVGNTTIGSSYFINNTANINFSANSPTFLPVGGYTTITRGQSWRVAGVYVAYSYIRNDGYYGPVDFFNTARNIITQSTGSVPPTAGDDYFGGAGATYRTILNGFTIPATGVSAIALWVGVDKVDIGFTTGQGFLGAVDSTGGTSARKAFSETLIPSADLSRFWLYTTIPVGSLFLNNINEGGSSYPLFYAATFILSNLDSIYTTAPFGGWSGMPNNFFATFLPKYQEINLNTMWIGGFSASPSTVAFSDVGQPEVYQPEDSFEVRTNDGDALTGIQAYNNQIILTKFYSFHKVIGDSASNYQLVQMSDQYGCVSQKTFVQYNQVCLWLDKKGVLEYNGANFSVISTNIEPIFKRMNLSAAREKAVGVHHVYRNQIWWGIPVDGSTQNNLTIVYDYLIGAFTFFDGYNPSSYAFVQGPLNVPTVWRGDYSGFIHYTGESFFTDSGRSITCLIQPRFENVGGQNQTTLWRRFFLDVVPMPNSITGIINGNIYSNYDSNTVQATFSMPVNIFQSRVEMGIQAKACSVDISYNNASFPLQVNGYAWSQRALRNV